MTRTRLTLIASVLVLAAVLTGCGSSELTATEFRTKVNAMCAKAKVDTEKVGKTLTSTSTEADIKKAIGQAVDRDRKLADDIDALNPPKNLSSDVDAMLKSLRSALTTMGTASVAELGSMQDPFKDANAKAKALGLDTCAKS